LIETPVDINIRVEWEDLGTGTLGSTYINSSLVVRGLFIGAYEPEALYPYPIAEKMYGKEINEPDDYEIEMSFNSEQNWYFGTDGNPLSTEYDFVTVAIHEICHGLGFNSTMGISNDLGWWGYISGLTLYFDHFIKNGSLQQLIDTSLFENGSVALSSQYTSNNLLFDSPIARSVNAGSAPWLYAPGVYDPGSSIAHLNEYTYPSGNPNSLMTPFVSFGEAIHDPGPITLAIFAEIGWIHTSIEHDTLKDAESLIDPFTVTAKIFSDTSIITGSEYLCHSTDSFATYDSVLLIPSGNPNEFSADIPVTDTGITVSYYLTAEDYFNRIYTKPSGAPGNYYTFFVGRDTIPPYINHDPVSFILTSNDSLDISAEAYDNIGIDSVYIEYLVNGTPQEPSILANSSANIYKGYMDLTQVSLEHGDSIQYRIVAVDSSLSGNISYHPDSAYHLFYASSIPEAIETYENDFNQVSDDFLGNGFNIVTPSGFANPALHTTHPYESPDEDFQSINYIAQLRYPIRVNDSSTYMKFDEIVLVEPGEAGTVFSDDEFWDYVIIEVSKDLGVNWFSLIDGYDSRDNTLWKITYNSTIENGNSLAAGHPNLYRSHEINLRENDNINGGDEILIRFRLYSDPYAHGWGWVIDNLQIQGYVSSVQDPLFNNGDIRIYPNPVSTFITIEGKIKPNVTEFNVSLTDLLGREIFTRNYKPSGEDFSEIIDLSGVDPGLYIIRIWSGNRSSVLRIIKSY